MTDAIDQRIRPVPIEDELRSAYLDYAMSVIVSRALPDVRDGLKPVHRRVLYTMHEMGLSSTASYRKCAAIVGEVMGKYHPHGDLSLYDALVRLAQDFSLRYPLVDGQGNFGSVDGDPPAAMRYTEARMTAIASELLADIDKDTVEFVENYDGSRMQPSVLPAKLPNLLINGSAGIAVGMATNIPPHHLGEITRATNALIEDPDLTSDQLCEYVLGPDFPTARHDLPLRGAAQPHHRPARAHRRHPGHVRPRSRPGRDACPVRLRGDARQARMAIVVTELPYQVNKAALVEKIAELVKGGKVDGISGLQDESSRDGMRMVIECKRDSNPHKVLNNLFKHTALQMAFNANIVALVDGQPQTLPLKAILQHHIDWRREVIVKRTEYDLQKARDRAHILEGLKVALDNLDEVIATIRAAADVDDARAALMSRFGLSEIQANAILEMQLRRLAALERKKIEDEYVAIIQLIGELEDILANPRRVLDIIKAENDELERKYAGPRRTRIAEDASRELSDEDLIADEDVVITVSGRGYIKRQPLVTYRRQARGGKGIIGARTVEEDAVGHLLVANTHDWALFFTDRGRVFSSKVHAIPDASRQAKGVPIINLEGVQVEAGERVLAVITPAQLREGRQPGHGHPAGHHQEDARGAVRTCPFDRHPGHHRGRGRCARVGRRLVRARTTSCSPRRRAGSRASTRTRSGRWVAMPRVSSASGSPARATRSWAWAWSGPSRPAGADRDGTWQADTLRELHDQAPRRPGSPAHRARGAQDRQGRGRGAGHGDGRGAAAHQRQRPGRAHRCPERQPHSSGARGVIVMRLHEGDTVAGIAVFRAGLAEQRGIDQNDPAGSVADGPGGDGTPA